ncbi:MAG: efflux RND transporter periplasmic adaptor subunit [Ignavibacteriales bacterium]|nr:MAG: efflux RND transporter periplasmic adaptor subunit [Ignavibacteriales bacterium]
MKLSIKFLMMLAVLSTGFYGCGGNETEMKEEHKDEHSDVIRLSDESIKHIGLKTATVKLQPFTGYITLPAKVITNQDNEAQIGSLVQGRVHQVFVKVGDFVKTGQVLMTVEGLDVGVIKAGYLKAKANLEFVKADYERHKTLMDQNIGSKQSYFEAKAEYEKALAEFDAEDKKVHSIGLDDEDVTNENNNSHTAGTLPIKSSINGIVVERNVVIGQLVDATTNAFKVINTSNVWIDGQIYEKDIAKLNQKTSAIFTTGTYVNEKFNGKIIYIGQTVDEQTRTITIRGEFSNANNRLKPQMFGELKIPVGADAKAIMIPEEAVTKETGTAYVFVQTSDTSTPVGGQVFEKRNVVTGSTVDELIEIKEGLKEGEIIATKGVFYLKSELKKEEIEGDEH